MKVVLMVLEWGKWRMKKIVVAHLVSVLLYPPVISLLQNLLSNGYKVFFVSCEVDSLAPEILLHPNFKYTNIDIPKKRGIWNKISRRVRITREGRNAVKKYMEEADVLWITTDASLLYLGSIVKKDGYVMQLMELLNYCSYVARFPFIRFPIEIYAENAWKVVVPEMNRAYIQKVHWNLSKTPYVLPNKPYQLCVNELSQDVFKAMEMLKNEKRKTLLYLGVLCEDRNFDLLFQAVERLDDYRLYIVGKPILEAEGRTFNEQFSKYQNVRYLGYFPAPMHLALLQYAHIGLLPYRPTKQNRYMSELNALYCAPNKIFEYSGYGVPMLGSDVLGLKIPFEMYHIGVCYSDSADSVIDALQVIEMNYEEMKKNCYKYFESVDLDRILKNILEYE